jgi:hypothetical protein
MSPPRPEENGWVISVHHCQSQFPAQLDDGLADPRGCDERASDGRIRRRGERVEMEEEEEEEEEGEEEKEEIGLK